MNKWVELLIGLLIVVGLIIFTLSSSYWGAFWNFKHAAWEFLKGGIVWLIGIVGLALIVLGINDLRQ